MYTAKIKSTKMKLLCIDPGTETSGVVLIDTETQNIIQSWGEINNFALLAMISLDEIESDHMAIEMIASYGMAVGKTTFETCVWIGRFIQAYNKDNENHTCIYRGDVKDALCRSRKAKDANIRQALIDRYKGTGGGKCPQVGTKSSPGPLYGISTHAWPALAIGHTWIEMNK